MNDNQHLKTASPEPESQPSKGKSGQFWQVFWLTFLVVSLGYAWYSFYAPSNRIVWAANYTTAHQQAVESDKPIILFFTAKWCSPCRIMKRNVWADEQVMNTVNSAFIPVTIEVDDPVSAAALSRYRIGVTPTTIITDPQGKVLARIEARMDKTNFLELLRRLNSSAAPPNIQ
jgi:thioredoxin 1